MTREEEIKKEIDDIYKLPVERGGISTHDMKWFEKHYREFMDYCRPVTIADIKAELANIRHSGHVNLTFLDGYVYGIYRSSQITEVEFNELRKFVTKLKYI